MRKFVGRYHNIYIEGSKSDNKRLSQNRHSCVSCLRRMWSLVISEDRPASQWAGVFLSKKITCFMVYIICEVFTIFWKTIPIDRSARLDFSC